MIIGSIDATLVKHYKIEETNMKNEDDRTEDSLLECLLLNWKFYYGLFLQKLFFCVFNSCCVRVIKSHRALLYTLNDIPNSLRCRLASGC